MSSIETPSSSQRKIPHPKASKFATERPLVVRDFLHPASTMREIPIKESSRSLQQLPSTQPQDRAISQTVLEFASSPFGTDLQGTIIAHSDDLQKLLDDNQIAWGVQYELARGVSAGLWDWDKIKDRVHELKGTNREAAFKVERIMKSRDSSRPSDDKLWYAVICNVCASCQFMHHLGSSSTWNREQSWRTEDVDLV